MNLQVGFRLTYLFPDWAEKKPRVTQKPANLQARIIHSTMFLLIQLLYCTPKPGAK